MLVLIFFILVLTFRSLWLPLKAIILNLFSVAATYGILVFVFALGHGSELFNVEANGYIIHFVPVLLLALLFGLSTDYEVFLVSRVKEEYDRTGENEASIAEGMEKTGPLITGAADTHGRRIPGVRVFRRAADPDARLRHGGSDRARLDGHPDAARTGRDEAARQSQLVVPGRAARTSESQKPLGKPVKVSNK